MPSFAYILRDLDEPHPDPGGTAHINGIPVGRIIDYRTDHMGVDLVIVEHEHVTLGGRPLDIGSELAEYRSMVATALVNEFARNPHTTVRSLAEYLQVTYSAARDALQNGAQAIEFALITVSPEALHELGEGFMVPRPPPPADDTPEDYYQLRVRLAAHLTQEYREGPEGPTVHWMADTFGITESDARHSLDRELREGTGLARSFLLFREDLVAGMAEAVGIYRTGTPEVITSIVYSLDHQEEPRVRVRTSHNRDFEVPPRDAGPGRLYELGHLVPQRMETVGVAAINTTGVVRGRISKSELVPTESPPSLWEHLDED